jgi:hypothetical protein
MSNTTPPAKNLPSPENSSRYWFTRELFWLQGEADRLNGLPCRSANGSYLNGWYATTPNNQNHRAK